jgi:hypothetical protein
LIKITIFYWQGLSGAVVQGVLDVIQQNIQARDDRMSWLDGCCLQVRAGKETFTFHVKNPGVKKDWIIGTVLPTYCFIIKSCLAPVP